MDPALRFRRIHFSACHHHMTTLFGILESELPIEVVQIACGQHPTRNILEVGMTHQLDYQKLPKAFPPV